MLLHVFNCRVLLDYKVTVRQFNFLSCTQYHVDHISRIYIVQVGTTNGTHVG